MSIDVEDLALKIAGEIVLSDEPGASMRDWRRKFSISQRDLAEELEITPSVLSDYENGRRKNPGVGFIKRFVKALLNVDRRRGGVHTLDLIGYEGRIGDAVIEFITFPALISIKRLNRSIKGRILTRIDQNLRVGGYVVIDSEVAVRTILDWKFFQLMYGSDERALIFTDIRLERSPILLNRFNPFKPRVMVYHGVYPSDLDIKLAELDGIMLISSEVQGINNLRRSLRRLYESVLRRSVHG